MAMMKMRGVVIDRLLIGCWMEGGRLVVAAGCGACAACGLLACKREDDERSGSVWRGGGGDPEKSAQLPCCALALIIVDWKLDRSGRV
eukprot:scaffold18586_cov72-Cyclotella_meneghiniana.AAC.10